MGSRTRSAGFFALGLLLAAASTWLRFRAFCQTEFANGWDSYYYLVQLKSLEETGRMHAPEGSLIYPYLRLFYWFSGDYVWGLKFGVAVLCGIWTALLFALPRARMAGLLLASWSVFSPHLTYFAAQYPKNLFGMALFLALVAAWERGGKKRALYTAILLVLNYFGHRLTFGLSVLFLLLQFFWENGASGKQWLSTVFRAKFSIISRKNGWIVGVAMAAIVWAGLKIPGLAHWMDIARLRGVLVWPPQFAPWSFFSQFGMERIGAWWAVEVVLVTLLWLSTLTPWRLRLVGNRSWVLPVLCGLLLFPFLEWSFTGLSWRLFLVFISLAPIMLKDAALAVHWKYAAGLLLLASFFSWKNYVPALHDPNYAAYSRATASAMRHLGGGNRPELVIAHNALAEYFTFTTGIDAMPWLPEYAIDSTRLWRLALGVQPTTLNYYVPDSQRVKVYDIGGGYFLLPEYSWQRACEKAAREGDAWFLDVANSWRNPHQVRPDWLLQRKK